MATKIKIVKADKSVTSTDPRDYLVHSDYPMFKYHNEYTASVTFDPGDQSQTTYITHGLGYVPAFLAYAKRNDNNANIIIPSLPFGISEFDWAEAYATNDRIYFKVTLFDNYNGSGWNQIIQKISDYFNSYTNSELATRVGNKDGTNVSGAMRFSSIPLIKDQSIQSATLNHRVYSKGAGSGDLKIKTYGIAEDNTSSFNNPFGRTKTSAVTSQSQSMGSSTPFTFGINVKSQVEEIIARSGWSSGNAMGFILDDDSSPFDVYAEDGVGTLTDVSYIDILKTGTLTVNFRVVVFKDKIA